MSVLSKVAGAPNRQWSITFSGAANFNFWISSNGTAWQNVASTHPNLEIGVWFFVAIYFEPSTVQRIYVARADEDTLVVDDFPGAVPAQIFTGGVSNFNIGAVNGVSTWNGRLGVGAGRCNVPAASVSAHLLRLFFMTRQFYL